MLKLYTIIIIIISVNYLHCVTYNYYYGTASVSKLIYTYYSGTFHFVPVVASSWKAMGQINIPLPS